MRKIILYVLLFASFIFAQNCNPISDELKTVIKDDMWERKNITMLVQNGVVCDNGIFYNVYYPTETISSTCDQLKIPGLTDYVAFFNLEDAKRLIVGIEKLETNKKKHKKELNEYIYIGDDSILNELKK